MQEPFTLAVDDADSRLGGCTTHLAGILLLALRGKIWLSDYPLLVRLAPGVPWKTRGNAAVVIKGYTDIPLRELLETVYSLAVEYSEGRRGEAGKAPGVALYPGVEPWREESLRFLYTKALTGLIHKDLVVSTARKTNVMTIGGKGIIGATSSLAALAPSDPYTYELIAYRRPENWRTPRCVRSDPMIEANIPPCTFNNIDLSTGKTVAAPHGPDPVLAGFRGSCPGWLGMYHVLLCEEPHFWVLYRSNQHTDVHHMFTGKLTPYSSLRAKLKLKGDPSRGPGGHVLAPALLGDTSIYMVAAYRESYPLTILLSALREGDELDAGVTAKPRGDGITLSLEKIYSIRVSPRTVEFNPRCPMCGARMKSAGRGKGYKCPRCGYTSKDMSRVRIIIPTPIASSELTPLPGRVSHLTLPAGYKPALGLPSPPGSVDRVISVGKCPPPDSCHKCKCLPSG